jgi:two-component system, chemotaxis family, protein-glutamate methylesterase/glutaminase
MSKIRVMIVEDSRVVREFLVQLIGADPRLEVAVAVDCAEEALRLLERVSPDVISMDIRLPGMNGFEATQQIMTRKPTPIVVVSASVEAEDLKVSMNALRAGALSVVEKPAGLAHEDYERLARRLCDQLVLMSQVKVIRQRIDRGVRFAPARPSLAAVHATQASVGPFRMVGMVASTGGPAALTQIFRHLPADFPVPILVIQHITSSFLEGFATWLGSIAPLPVRFARDGETAAAGTIYLPSADRHLRVEGTRLRLDASAPVNLQRPSGTILFRSMAQSAGSAALGVLLTGMGEDGAEGLRELRQAGGYTLAEDESTAVVYGMPAVAIRLGAVCESLPLSEIGPRVVELVGAQSEQ